MSPEQESVRRSQTLAAVHATAKNGTRDAVAKSARPATVAPAEADRLQLRVSFPRRGEYHGENSRLFPLPANRWERLEIPLPADWQGGGLRLDPQCRFGLLEIVGVRIVSGVMGQSLWEMLGRDLLGGVRVSAGMQVLSNKLRLRLLCTGDDAQITLPDLALPSAEVPLVLELGLRVRTDLASIGYTLHEWVDDANTKLRDTLAQLADAEAARAHNEGWARALLAEVDVARADGNRREAALQQQLAGAHEAARTLAARLTAEIETARAHGEERAATLLTEIEVARRDGSQQAAALHSQLAAAGEAARAHAARLAAEIETARAHGEQRAATLLGEIDALRADGHRREAAFQEQLAGAHEAGRTLAAALTAEIETARAFGEERAVALTAEIDAARTDGNRREAAFQEQLADAHEASRTLAARLTAEIEMARAFGEERAAALTAEGSQREAALQEQLTGAQEAARALAATLAEQQAAGQRLEQTLSLSNQQMANVQAELTEARRFSEEHRGRVRSMQRSLSWRLTLPLRIVGRTLTGRRPASRKVAP